MASLMLSAPVEMGGDKWSSTDFQAMSVVVEVEVGIYTSTISTTHMATSDLVRCHECLGETSLGGGAGQTIQAKDPRPRGKVDFARGTKITLGIGGR